MTATSFLRGQLQYLVKTGWEVRLLCGVTGLEHFASSEGVRLEVVTTARQPSRSDLLSLMKLWRRLRTIRPGATVMSTPKMGVLGTLAAALARVPVRVYFVLGYRAEGLGGAQRIVMRWMDRLACAVATDVVPVSDGLGALLVREGVTTPGKLRQLPGASATLAVDLDRFTNAGPSDGAAARQSLGLAERVPVVAFVGRLTGDKGLVSLPETWARIRRQCPDAILLVVGTPEPIDDDDRAALLALDSATGVVRQGYLEHVETAYRSADVLMVLSKREGLGVVVLEAAACGVPTVGYAVTGIADTVVDGVTGELCSPGDADSVADSVAGLLQDSRRLQEMGRAARARVAGLFGPDVVWPAWDQFLHGLSRPEARKRG